MESKSKRMPLKRGAISAKKVRPASNVESKAVPRASEITNGKVPTPLRRPTANARFYGVSAERDRLEKTVEAERAERMFEYAAQLEAVKDETGLAIETVSSPVVRILAEGDSWFDYPPGVDVIGALKKLIKLPIANMAHHGDEVRQMLALKQRKELEQRMAKGAPDGKPWDALLFSGGGNDMVGDELCIWIKTYSGTMNADQLVDTKPFGAVLGIIEAGYRDLIALRDRLSPGTKIFVNQYDFALPSGKGVCNVGPWLKPSLDFRVIPPDMQGDVVKVILTKFATLLASIATSTSNFFPVPTQGTLPGSTNEWWANEIHPTDKGFKLIAEQFLASMKAQFPHIPLRPV